jgi:hypothetical protein
MARRTRTRAKKVAKKVAKKAAPKKAGTTRGTTLMVRVPTPPPPPPAVAPAQPVMRAAVAPGADEVPEATISAAAGAVSVEIVFGFAQHGQYTIQLFDPAATTELARETGLSTDAIPDRFALKQTPKQLDGHLLQWSGAVDAFSPAPGQQFSVIFDVSQGGQVVPGGHKEKIGPLNVTQAFLGVLRLVSK